MTRNFVAAARQSAAIIWGGSQRRSDEPPLRHSSNVPMITVPTLFNPQSSKLSRRDFLAASSLLALAAVVPGCKTAEEGPGHEPIIDIHQHLGYSGRSGEVLLARPGPGRLGSPEQKQPRKPRPTSRLSTSTSTSAIPDDRVRSCSPTSAR